MIDEDFPYHAKKARNLYFFSNVDSFMLFDSKFITNVEM